MDHGATFGFDNFLLKKTYFDQHRTGTLITNAGKDYTIHFFAAGKVNATEKIVFDPPNSTNEELLQFIKQHAAIILIRRALTPTATYWRYPPASQPRTR